MLLPGGYASATDSVEASAPAGLQPSILEISVNGQAGGEAVIVLRDARGALFVPLPELVRWRLNAAGVRTIEWSGERYAALKDLPGLTAEIVAETQILRLTAPAELFETSTWSFDEEAGPMTPSGWGGFLNYELLGQHAQGETTLNSATELGLFNRYGVGIATFVGGWSAQGVDFTRLETNWTIDDPRKMRSLRIGDGITRGGAGSPLRFGGIQFTRNFAVRPGFLTFPTPSLGGGAALPSMADLYVNNSLRETRRMASGPFRVLDVPVITGAGDVQLIVRDGLGRETVISQSYYAAPQLLRQGLQDYSYEIGFLREDFGRQSNSYGTPFVSGIHRYGFNKSLTGEMHASAARDIQTGGVAIDLLLGDLGLASVGAAISNSHGRAGGSLRLGFERRTLGVSLGGTAEFTTDHYAAMGLGSGRRPPARMVQLFAGVPTALGSVAVAYLRRDARGEPDAELLSATASLRLATLGTLQLAARKNFTGEREAALEMSVIFRVGRRTSASAGLQSRGGEVRATTTLQNNPIAGEGIGYRLSAVAGETNRLQAWLGIETDLGSYGADLSWTDHETGVRMVAAGSIGTVGGRVFAARKLTQSFAVVQVGNYSNVRVYADNQPIGRTNGKGVIVVPRLRPYEKNVVRLEVADLPIDALLSGTEATARPYSRSGVEVRFDARPAVSALLELHNENGEPLPAGATVRLDGRSEEFVVAPGGQVYLTGLQAHNEGQARAGGKACSFSFDLPESDDPQPRLGIYKCELSDS